MQRVLHESAMGTGLCLTRAHRSCKLGAAMKYGSPVSSHLISRDVKSGTDQSWAKSLRLLGGISAPI